MSIPSRDPFGSQLQAAMPKAFVAAVRIVNNADDAREICQDSAAKAWSRRGSYDPSREFYPWFYRIVKNGCLDFLRRRGTRVSKDDALRSELPSTTAPVGLGQLLQSERESALWSALSQLDPAYREILELRHFQDLSYEEIAEVLAIANGTVMSRLYRARKALWAELRVRAEFQENQ